MTSTNGLTEGTPTNMSSEGRGPGRVSRRTLAIMAATVAAVGVVAAPSLVDALGADAARGSVGNVEPVEVTEPFATFVPDTLPNVDADVDVYLPETDVDDGWPSDDLNGGDWVDCPGCGLG